MYYSIPEAILHNHRLHIFVWLYLANTHHFQLLIDIFIRLYCMIYVHNGDNSKELNHTCEHDFFRYIHSEISFARNVRSSAVCFYYVVCNFILSLFETPPEVTMSYFFFSITNKIYYTNLRTLLPACSYTDTHIEEDTVHVEEKNR